MDDLFENDDILETNMFELQDEYGNVDSFDLNEYEYSSGQEEEHINNEEQEKVQEEADKKEISFGGRYKCTCGCTHFNDVGGNMCSCGHLWWNHKFWST